MLEIRKLDVSIGSVSILRGVDMEVGNGQFVGLIGRNGAGKTTLLRAIMGILTPRAGSVSFDGKPLDSTPTHLRARAGIGYMPEDRRLVPTLTVEENVLIPAWAGNRTDAEERLKRIYTMIPEVETFRARRGLQLSGGQQKLVALARALMSGTQLLLLDEPFEGVAPVLARRLAEVIGGLRSQGLSIIITESDLSHSRDMLDRIY
ncbi:MAG: ABC transporter ATP-binding protein, partial [Burkholderiales bacterium]|nr:ABC transporter ATP-binding protein [Burkholderiales bacterium]